MKNLMLAIQSRMQEQLPYLQWVGILESEQELPATIALPALGLKDGGLVSQSLPGKKDIETITMFFVAYQQVLDAEVGASVIGSEGNLGSAGRGLLDIADDIKAALNDDFLTQQSIHYAHRDSVDPSDMLVSPDGDAIQKQRTTYTYRRYV
jgi:hypothetical protein